MPPPPPDCDPPPSPLVRVLATVDAVLTAAAVVLAPRDKDGVAARALLK